MKKKTCSRCKQSLALSKFGVSNTRADRTSPRCKSCNNAVSKICKANRLAIEGEAYKNRVRTYRMTHKIKSALAE